MKVQKHTAILFRTMHEMPDTFTSYDFTQMAYKNGHPQLPANTGFHEFVKKYAKNDGAWSKTWTKKTAKVQPQIEPQIEIKTERFDIQPMKKYPTDEDMISHLRGKGYIVCLSIGTTITYLKQKGYKVMKHIDKWEEC
jgi:hypothetical protein